MSDPDLTEAEATELFGGPAREVHLNGDHLMVQLALRTIRDELMNSAEHDKVGVNQWARRLGISPSSVSRFLGGEGDFHVSTAILYARALGRRWGFTLAPDRACATLGNHSGRPEIRVEFVGGNEACNTVAGTVPATSTAAAPTVMIVPLPSRQWPEIQTLVAQSVA